jgi:hypothetical protein
MRTLVLLLCAAALWAATLLDGAWKLNRDKSTVNGPLPSFIHNDRISVVPGGMSVPGASPFSFIAVDGNGEHRMYRVEVSPDRRILTMMRIQSYEDQTGQQFHTVLVLEKQ